MILRSRNVNSGVLSFAAVSVAEVEVGVEAVFGVEVEGEEVAAGAFSRAPLAAGVVALEADVVTNVKTASDSTTAGRLPWAAPVQRPAAAPTPAARAAP